MPHSAMLAPRCQRRRSAGVAAAAAVFLIGYKRAAPPAYGVAPEGWRVAHDAAPAAADVQHAAWLQRRFAQTQSSSAREGRRQRQAQEQPPENTAAPGAPPPDPPSSRHHIFIPSRGGGRRCLRRAHRRKSFFLQREGSRTTAFLCPGTPCAFDVHTGSLMLPNSGAEARYWIGRWRAAHHTQACGTGRVYTRYREYTPAEVARTAAPPSYCCAQHISPQPAARTAATVESHRAAPTPCCSRPRAQMVERKMTTAAGSVWKEIWYRYHPPRRPSYRSTALMPNRDGNAPAQDRSHVVAMPPSARPRRTSAFLSHCRSPPPCRRSPAF